MRNFTGGGSWSLGGRPVIPLTGKIQGQSSRDRTTVYTSIQWELCHHGHNLGVRWNY